jgi:hypothetical protein
MVSAWLNHHPPDPPSLPQVCAMEWWRLRWVVLRRHRTGPQAQQLPSRPRLLPLTTNVRQRNWPAPTRGREIVPKTPHPCWRKSGRRSSAAAAVKSQTQRGGVLIARSPPDSEWPARTRMSALGHKRTSHMLIRYVRFSDGNGPRTRRRNRGVGDSQIWRFEQTAISAGIAIRQHENTIAAIMKSTRIARG